MKEKQRIENMIRNIVEATSSQPKRFPIVPVKMKNAKSNKSPLIKNHVMGVSFDYGVSIR